MKRLLLVFLMFPLLAFAVPAPLAAQETPAAPLEDFVRQVARLWMGGEAAALVELAPADGKIILNVGETSGSVQGRHAAAALRALFAERESITMRPTRVTVSGGRPLRGFGEFSWVSRSRGMTVPQTATLYVGAIWEGDSWRVRELRVLP